MSTPTGTSTPVDLRQTTGVKGPDPMFRKELEHRVETQLVSLLVPPGVSRDEGLDDGERHMSIYYKFQIHELRYRRDTKETYVGLR